MWCQGYARACLLCIGERVIGAFACHDYVEEVAVDWDFDVLCEGGYIFRGYLYWVMDFLCYGSCTFPGYYWLGRDIDELFVGPIYLFSCYWRVELL